MIPQNWEDARERLDALKPVADEVIGNAQKDIGKYPKLNDNGEHLSQLLSNLNWYVVRIGDLHAEAEGLKTWTEKRYEVEKGLEFDRLVKVEKMGVTQAASSKYVKVQEYLGTMVRAGVLAQRLQNAKMSTRDTSDSIRVRISQLKSQLRSS